jgi:hypothetical protein
VELGAYTTSFIPTISSIVTRNADIISKTGIGSDILNPLEGTFYAEIAASANDVVLRQVALGGLNSKVVIRFNATSGQLRLLTVGTGGGVWDVLVAVPTTLNFHKCLIKWGPLGIFGYVNGTKYPLALVTGTGNGIPITLDAIYFSDYNTTNFFYGKCKSLQVYKTALTDAQCFSLTTL